MYLLLLITGLITFCIDYNNYNLNKESNFSISNNYISFLINDLNKYHNFLNKKAAIVNYKLSNLSDYEYEEDINFTNDQLSNIETSTINNEHNQTLNDSDYYFYLHDKLFISIKNKTSNNSILGFDCSSTESNGKCKSLS